MRVRGRRERSRQYCQKDFGENFGRSLLLRVAVRQADLLLCSLAVFRGKVLERVQSGEETRYDVQIIHTYRNRYRLEHREFLWVPNVCDCPHLERGRQYVFMARRHINYERTLNRILLEEDSYVVPYRAREDELLWTLEGLCSNRRPLQL